MHKTILRYRYIICSYLQILSVVTYDTYLCMYDYVLIEIGRTGYRIESSLH